jgi:hypothetical protein
MAETKNAPAKKGNKTTELVIGAGASKLMTAVTQLKSVVEVIDQLPAKVQENVLLVSDLEDKIGGLKQQLENQTAQNKIELQQAYDADKQTFVNKWMNDNKMTAVEVSTFTKMEETIEKAEEVLENTVKAEVAKAVNIEKSNSTNALKVMQLEHEKKEASNQAEITQLKQQNKFLEEQMGYWKTALEDERKAGIERSKASAISTLNIGGTTQGR